MDGLFKCNDEIFKGFKLKYQTAEGDEKLYLVLDDNTHLPNRKKIARINKKSQLIGLYTQEGDKTTLVKFEYKTFKKFTKPVISKYTFVYNYKSESKRVLSEIEYDSASSLLVPSKYYVTMKTRKKQLNVNDNVAHLKQDALVFSNYKIALKHDDSKNTNTTEKK